MTPMRNFANPAPFPMVSISIDGFRANHSPRKALWGECEGRHPDGRRLPGFCRSRVTSGKHGTMPIYQELFSGLADLYEFMIAICTRTSTPESSRNQIGTGISWSTIGAMEHERWKESRGARCLPWAMARYLFRRAEDAAGGKLAGLQSHRGPWEGGQSSAHGRAQYKQSEPGNRPAGLATVR